MFWGYNVFYMNRNEIEDRKIVRRE
jgi:hypothetical protein